MMYFLHRYLSAAFNVQGTGQVNKCATTITLQACEDQPSFPALPTDKLLGY